MKGDAIEEEGIALMGDEKEKSETVDRKCEGATELVPFTWSHVAKTFTWVTNPELRRAFLIQGEPNWEGHQEYFRGVLADPTQRVYAIEYANCHVGNCGIKYISQEHQRGEAWIYVGDTSLRGRGIGKAAMEFLLEEAFRKLHLLRVCAHVADFNTASLALCIGVGFVEVTAHDESPPWSGWGCRVIEMDLTYDRWHPSV